MKNIIKNFFLWFVTDTTPAEPTEEELNEGRKKDKAIIEGAQIIFKQLQKQYPEKFDIKQGKVHKFKEGQFTVGLTSSISMGSRKGKIQVKAEFTGNFNIDGMESCKVKRKIGDEEIEYKIRLIKNG